MKKSLIALAVIAASGAAMAQSSVTLYGTVDAFVGSDKKGVGTTRVSNGVVNSGGIKANRFGFKGSEDLGGGLKAIFQLEERFTIDNGAQDGVMFKGRSAVGLAGNFGEVRFGREYTAYDTVRGDFAGGVVFDASVFSPVGDVFKLQGMDGTTKSTDYEARSNNQIRYVTPNFSGFTAGVSYGLGEDKAAAVAAVGTTAAVAAVTKASSIAAAFVNYANGPVKVGYAHQSEKPNTANTNGAAASTTSSPGTDKYNFLGASYDLGMVKLTGMYQNRKQLTVKDNDYAFGVEVPMGAFTLAAGYAAAKQKNAAGTTLKAKGFGVMGSYAFSKRTDVYVGLKATELKTAAGVKTADNDTFGLGVRHSF